MNKVFWNLKVWFYRQINRSNIVKSQSRKALEYDLFYYIQKEIRPKKILFVGVASYTSYYYRLFPGVVFETIDSDSGAMEWGTPNHHACIDTIGTTEVFSADTFDVVILNGVYGWGTNSEQHLHEALKSIHIILRPEGLLLFGWNQVKEYDPLDIENNLNRYFSGYTICSLQKNNHLQFDDWARHTFMFFKSNKRNTIKL